LNFGRFFVVDLGGVTVIHGRVLFDILNTSNAHCLHMTLYSV
jgi:hypothetical protein